MQCPGCQGRMAETRQADVEVDICRKCDGVWFDHGELESYAANARSGPSATHSFVGSSESRSCPKCETDKLEAGVCKTCRGVWLSSPAVTAGTSQENSIVESLVEGTLEVVDLAVSALDIF